MTDSEKRRHSDPNQKDQTLHPLSNEYDIAVNIIFEHPDFVIVDKPAGVDFHNSSHNSSHSRSHNSSHSKEAQIGFFNQVKAKLIQRNQTETLYPVHRLDKDTSGLIIFAKNLAAEHFFNHALQTGLIEKYYLAVSHHKPKKKQGFVIGDMERTRNKAWRLMHSKVNPAKTYFHSFNLGDATRLYILKPYTGKTHQLRVAMRAISATIWGDSIYKGEAADRLYLHAYALKFNYNNTEIEITQLPSSGKVFERLVTQLNPQQNTQLNPQLTDVKAPDWHCDLQYPWQLNWPK